SLKRAHTLGVAWPTGHRRSPQFSPLNPAGPALARSQAPGSRAPQRRQKPLPAVTGLAQAVQRRDILAAVIGAILPAGLVIIGQALLDQGFHLLERARALSMLQGKKSHEFVAARVVHLIELMACAEFTADRIPQQLHHLDPRLVVDAARSAHVFLKVFVDLGILEV